MNYPELSRYRNAEFLQYMRQTLETVNKEEVATLQLTDPVTQLTTIFEEMNASFLQVQGSKLTVEIQELDELRDRAYRGFRSLAIANTYHKEKTKADAGQNMLAAIDGYGPEIAKRNYNEQTGILYSMVKDFETKEELIAAVQTLQLADWLAEIKETNSAFDAKYLDRVDETALNPLVNFPELRKQAMEAYRVLISHIEAHATLSSNKVYTQLLDKISVLAGQYNFTLNQRSASGTQTPPEPTPPTEPDTSIS